MDVEEVVGELLVEVVEGDREGVGVGTVGEMPTLLRVQSVLQVHFARLLDVVVVLLCLLVHQA